MELAHQYVPGVLANDLGYVAGSPSFLTDIPSFFMDIPGFVVDVLGFLVNFPRPLVYSLLYRDLTGGSLQIAPGHA